MRLGTYGADELLTAGTDFIAVNDEGKLIRTSSATTGIASWLMAFEGTKAVYTAGYATTAAIPETIKDVCQATCAGSLPGDHKEPGGHDGGNGCDGNDIPYRPGHAYKRDEARPGKLSKAGILPHMDTGERGVMAKKYTIEQFRQQLMQIADPKRMGKSIMTPLRKGQRDIGKALKWAYWQHNLGGKVWEWRQKAFGIKGGPVVRTRKRQRTRWSASEQAYIAKIEVAGLAAKIEMGGRLEIHKMWGRKSDARTPGVMVSRRPVLDRMIQAYWPGTLDNVQKSFNRFIERTL